MNTEPGYEAATLPVRLPDETAESLRRVAAAQGRTPAAVMGDAWRWYMGRNGDKIKADLHVIVEALR